MSHEHVDVVIIGGGGAGLMCAAEAARRGRRTVVLDHGTKLGAKILISGGGRCNFTNVGAGPKNYVSENPHFCKSALARFSPAHFIALVEKHGIPYHEKKLGQLFCDDSARRIVELLTRECVEAGAEIRLGTQILSVKKLDAVFEVTTAQGVITCDALVIATGGLSIPKIGATGFGYDIARQFGLNVIEPSPALDGFVLSDPEFAPFLGLSGISADVEMECGGVSFRENILFTHTGLSGPAALQASLYWRKGLPVTINLLPERETLVTLAKQTAPRSHVRTALAGALSARLADLVAAQWLPERYRVLTLCDIPNQALDEFEARVTHWVINPERTVGYGKAEVTRGGVDTNELSSKTMESKKVPGLYFIGEVVDVTGWLGGYNFQWAWASGFCAGQAL